MTPGGEIAARAGAARRARVDALFTQALELEVAERVRFLLALGEGEDAALGAEVEELLRLAAEPWSDLEDAAAAIGSICHALAADLEPAAEPEPAPNAALGRWRIVRKLGEGGMGSVYLVERADGEFEQRAALKLVRHGGSEQVLRWFEQERQILATLNHPNIARLLDGGSESGRPYLVMEYVEGRSLQRYCDEERLSIEDRLALLVRIGRAIEYAHRHLIVHRDLKPSNIVVTADGEVKLLDFGIASLLSPTARRTEPPDGALVRVLTPEYASPEQSRGEPVTTASDVYQLGLLAYETLTGTRARRRRPGDLSSLRRAPWETVPLPASAAAEEATTAACAARRTSSRRLVRRLRGDLDAVLLCALRREPELRYGSAGALVEDLERHRQGLPVRARPATWSYRAAAFARRRRAALLWTAAVLLAAIVGIAGIASQQRRLAREAARGAQVERLVGELFALVSPKATTEPPGVRDFIDGAVGLVRGELASQPARQARLLTLLGSVYVAAGHYEPAAAVLEEALVLAERAHGRDSLTAAETLEWLSRSRHYQGRYPQAEASVRRVLAIRRAHRGSSDVTTLRAAADLGDLLHTQGRLAEAEGTLRAVAATLRRTAGDPAVLARALQDLGNVLRDRGAWEEAEASFREAIAVFHALFGDVDAQLGQSEVYFARLLILRGRFEEAERVLQEALVELRAIYGGDHALTGTALRELGHLRTAQGRFDEADAFLREAQAVFGEWLGAEHPLVPRARAHQAELALRRGRPEQAVATARRALGEFERLNIPEHPAAIDARRTLGEALLELGSAGAAAAELERVLAAGRRLYVVGDARTERTSQLYERARRAAVRPARAAQ